MIKNETVPLLYMLKVIYAKSYGVDQEFIWRDLYPNNMIENGKEGIYTVQYIPESNEAGEPQTFKFIKYTIKYQKEVGADHIIHIGAPVKYYILFEQIERYVDNFYLIPDPDDGKYLFKDPPEGYLHPTFVNTYGNFRMVFDSEEVAKQAAAYRLRQSVYPYLHILSDEDLEDFNKYAENIRKSVGVENEEF